MQTTPRNRSTRYEDHQGLLTKFARMYWGRISGVLPGIAFDDVLSELSIPFVQAQRSYNPELGFTFTALLSRCCNNHFNKWAERQILEQYGTTDGTHSTMGLGAVSVHEMAFEGDPYEAMADHSAEAPDVLVSRKQHLQQVLADKTVTPATRAYIWLTVNPGEQIAPSVRSLIAQRAPAIAEEVQRRWGIAMRPSQIRAAVALAEPAVTEDTSEMAL